LLQLEQALGGVTVRGQEFKSILDSMPVVMGTVVKHYSEASKQIQLEEAALRGASEAEIEAIKNKKDNIRTLADLRNAMYRGEISSAAFYRAILLGQTEVDEQFQKSHKTFAQAFNALENGFIKWVGGLNTATEASNKFYEIMSSISNNMDMVMKSLGIAASGVIAYGLGFVGLLVKINPIGVALATVTMALVGFFALKDDIKPFKDSIISLGDVFDVVTESISEKIDLWISKLERWFNYLANKNPKSAAFVSNMADYVGATIEYVVKETTGYTESVTNDIKSKANEKYSIKDYSVNLPKYDELPLDYSINQLTFGSKSADKSLGSISDAMLSSKYTSLRTKLEEDFNGELKFVSKLTEEQRIMLEKADIAQARIDEKQSQALGAQKQSREELLQLREKEFQLSKATSIYEQEKLKSLDTQWQNLGQEGQKKYKNELDYRKEPSAQNEADEYAKLVTPKLLAADEARKLETSLKERRDQAANFIAQVEQTVSAKIQEVNSRLENESIKHPVKIKVDLDKNNLSEKVKELQPIIDKASAKYNVPSNIIAAIIQKESGGNNVRSTDKKSTAAGVMQINKATAETFGVKDVYDQEESIMKAVAALSQRAAKVGLHNAIAAHNQGMGAIAKGQDYAKDVERIAGISAKPELKSSKQVLQFREQQKVIESDIVKYRKALADGDEKTAERLQHQIKLGEQKLTNNSKEINQQITLENTMVATNKRNLEQHEKETSAIYDAEKAYEALSVKMDEVSRLKLLISEKGAFALPDIEKSVKVLQSVLEDASYLKQSLAKRKNNLVDDYNASDTGSEKQLTILRLIDETNQQIADLNVKDTNVTKQKTEEQRLQQALLESQRAVVSDLNKGNEELLTKLTTSSLELEKRNAIKADGGLNSEESIRGLIDTRETLKGLVSVKETVLDSLKSGFITMFDDVLVKGKSFADAFRGMFKNLVSTISSSLMNIGMNAMMSGNYMAGGAMMVGGMAVSLLQTLFKGKNVDLRTPDSLTTGSVLGSSSESNSIRNIVNTLNSIHAVEYEELKAINSNFKDLVESTTKGTALALRDRGRFVFSTKDIYGREPTAKSKNPNGSVGMQAASIGTSVGISAATGGGLAGAGLGASAAIAAGLGTSTSVGVGVTAGALALGSAMVALPVALVLAGLQYGLGKLLGIGKVKFEAVGGGIVSASQKFVLDGMQKQVQVLDYSVVKTTVKGWFSDDVTYSEVINAVDNKMTKLFTGLLNNTKVALINSVSKMGILDNMNFDYVLPKMKLAMGTDPAKNQKKIEDWINKTGDDMAMYAVGATLSRFQQMGEGMLETVARLASETVVAKTGFEKLGVSVKLSGLGLVSFADSLAQAFGGLKEMQAGLQGLYDAFTTDKQKLTDAKKDIQSFLNGLKLPESANIPKEIKTDSDAVKVLNVLSNEAVKLQPALGALKAVVVDKSGANPTRANAQANFLLSYLPKEGREIIKTAGEKITTQLLEKALAVQGKYSLKDDNNPKTTTLNPSTYKELMSFANLNAKQEKSFDAALVNPEVKKTLSDLGIAMPKTVAEMESLVGQLDPLADAASTNVAEFSNMTKSIKSVTDWSKSVVRTVESLFDMTYSSDESTKRKDKSALPLLDSDTVINDLVAQVDSKLIPSIIKWQTSLSNVDKVLYGVIDTNNITETSLNAYIQATKAEEKRLDVIAKQKLAMDSLITSEGKLTSEYTKRQLADAEELRILKTVNKGSDSEVYDLLERQRATNQSSITGKYDELKDALVQAPMSQSEKDAYQFNKSIELINSQFGEGTEASKTFINMMTQERDLRLANVTAVESNVKVITAEDIAIKRRELSYQLATAGLSELEKEAVDFKKTVDELNETFGTGSATANEFIKTVTIIRDIGKAANFLTDVEQAAYDKKYSMATEAGKRELEFEKYKNDMVKKYGQETISGVTGSMKKSEAMIKLYVDNLKEVDFSKAVAGMRDFRRAIADWAIGLQITQLGSTKSQLDTAQAKLQYQISAYQSNSGIGSVDTSKIADKSVVANIEKYIAQTSTANKGKTVDEIKQGIISGITGTADQTISAIKNFYGSSKEGNDLIQQVIDSVSILPQQVDPQLRMVDLLEDIKTGVFAIPDSLKGTNLGSAIATSIDELNKIKASVSIPNDQKLAAVDALAKSIYDAVGLGLTTFNQTIKDEGAKILASATSAILGIMATLEVPEDKKAELITNITKSMANYTAIIDSKIKDPTSEFDIIMKNYQEKLLLDLDALNLIIAASMTAAGIQSGTNFVTEISKAIATIAGISIPPFNTSAAISSIDGIVSAAQRALDALRQIGAQQDAQAAANAAQAAALAVQAASVPVLPVLPSTPEPTQYVDTMVSVSKMFDAGGNPNRQPEPTLTATPYIASVFEYPNLSPGLATAAPPSVATVPQLSITPAETRVNTNALGFNDVKSAVNTALSNRGLAPSNRSQSDSNFEFYANWLRQNEGQTYYANGGAFTNGIVSEPTAFNIGVMGEAGSEGILPLANVNGKLGVHAVASNDSNMNSEEELAELKRQNQILIAQNGILQEGFKQLILQNAQQNDHLDDISSTTRKQVNN
jgi:soluble lytic murein transglycosylase-like protein